MRGHSLDRRRFELGARETGCLLEGAKGVCHVCAVLHNVSSQSFSETEVKT